MDEKNKGPINKHLVLEEAERRFYIARDQIVLLNRKLTELQYRYDAAKRVGRNSFRYNLRLRMTVLEGMKNVYYAYAHDQADNVAILRRELFGQQVRIAYGEHTETSEYSSV